MYCNTMVVLYGHDIEFHHLLWFDVEHDWLRAIPEFVPIGWCKATPSRPGHGMKQNHSTNLCQRPPSSSSTTTPTMSFLARSPVLRQSAAALRAPGQVRNMSSDYHVRPLTRESHGLQLISPSSPYRPSLFSLFGQPYSRSRNIASPIQVRD